jgi:hypothetical protein
MTGSLLYTLIRSCRRFVIHTVVYFEYISLNPFQGHVEVFFKNLDLSSLEMNQLTLKI